MGIFGIFKRKDRQPEEERPAPVQAPRPAAAPPMTPKEADMKYVGSFLRDYRNAEDDPTDATWRTMSLSNAIFLIER